MLYIATIPLLLVLSCIIHFIYQKKQTAKKKLAVPPVEDITPATQQKDPIDNMSEEILEALTDYKRSNKGQ